MNEFCTLVNADFLLRGLVLYRSLSEQTGADFRLRVFCADEATKGLLDRLALPGLEAIGLDRVEAHDRGLHGVKGDRSPREYLWTAKPAVCLYALETEPSLTAITFVDADLMFFQNPVELFDEIGDASVAIVPHAYAARFRGLEVSRGIYNSGWVTFETGEPGLRALRWWRDRCLEWCYDRSEDGKFGDQKYFDDWPQRFEGVHVLQHPGANLGPWNIEGHDLKADHGELLVDGRPLVFFHYHALRLFEGAAPLRRLAALTDRYRLTTGAHPVVWRLEDYPLAPEARELLFEPYLRRVGDALAQVRRIEPGFDGGLVSLGDDMARRAWLSVFHRVGSWTPRRLLSRS
jgi:hypothetical protein